MANALKLTPVQIRALESLCNPGTRSLNLGSNAHLTWRALRRRGLVDYNFKGGVGGYEITTAGRHALTRARAEEPPPLPAPADLAKSLKELVEYFGSPLEHGICHEGICSMKECVRCGHLLRAQALLDRVPKGWLEGT